MVHALNPKRYRVEPLRDQNAALLHAELVLAHALVVYIPNSHQLALRRCEEVSARLTFVLVSPDEEVAQIAEALGGRYVREPFSTTDFKRAVYRAVSRTQSQRLGTRRRLRDSQPRAVRRVAVMLSDGERASLMAAVMNANVDANCRVAASVEELWHNRAAPLDCLVAELEMVMASEHGPQLLRMLARRGIQLIPLPIRASDENVDAAEIAWDVTPLIRNALAVRPQPCAIPPRSAQKTG